MVSRDYDIENIVKATGFSEDELANLIIAKEKEGLTNDEIVDLLVTNFDNKEYAGKAQNELDAIYSLGFNPPKDYNPAGGKSYQQLQEYKEDPSLFDRFKSMYAANKDADEQRRAAERAAIANSVKDWRDSHPEQWRVGMVNALFGDNSMLSQHYAAKNADEVSEKNRESQREYNDYLKEYDRAKSEAEQSAAYKKELKEAEVDMAALNRDLVKANAPEAEVILKRQEALITKYPELKGVDTSTAEKAYKDEREYAANLNKYKGQIKLNFLTDDEIQNEIYRVLAESWIRPDDSDKIVEALQTKKSTAQLARESSQSAVASHAGKKTGESLDDKDITKKANDAIKNNISPARLKQEERDKIREMGYTWTTNGWSKR